MHYMINGHHHLRGGGGGANTLHQRELDDSHVDHALLIAPLYAS